MQETATNEKKNKTQTGSVVLSTSKHQRFSRLRQRRELKFQISTESLWNLFIFIPARNVCELAFAKIFHLRSDFIFTYAYVMHTIWCDYERILRRELRVLCVAVWN